jgi:hypothetical protein
MGKRGHIYASDADEVDASDARKDLADRPCAVVCVVYRHISLRSADRYRLDFCKLKYAQLNLLSLFTEKFYFV